MALVPALLAWPTPTTDEEGGGAVALLAQARASECLPGAGAKVCHDPLCFLLVGPVALSCGTTTKINVKRC